MALSALFFLWSTCYAPATLTYEEISPFLLHAAQQGFLLAVGILGFLIAGFSIFASITRADLFIALANIPYEETEINSLQFVFFNFINVFIVYLGLLVYSLIVILALDDHSPVVLLAARYLRSRFERG